MTRRDIPLSAAQVRRRLLIFERRDELKSSSARPKKEGRRPLERSPEHTAQLVDISRDPRRILLDAEAREE